MVHPGQHLPFLLEPVQDGGRIHSWLYELEGHGPPDRLVLLGRPDFAHPTLTESADERVGPDLHFALRRTVHRRGKLDSILKKACRPVRRGKQLVKTRPEVCIASASESEEHRPLGRRQVQRATKQSFDPGYVGGHDLT
jgi:hypothetical protein